MRCILNMSMPQSSAIVTSSLQTTAKLYDPLKVLAETHCNFFGGLGKRVHVFGRMENHFLVLFSLN